MTGNLETGKLNLKTRIAVNLHFIDRICIAEWIYRFCFGYEIQKKGGEFDVHNDIVLFRWTTGLIRLALDFRLAMN